MRTLKIPVIYTYKRGSASAKELAKELGKRFHLKRGPAKRVIAGGNPYIEPRYVVVTWGDSDNPAWQFRNDFTLNKPEAVALAANKLFTFQAFRNAGVIHPEWTTEPTEEWCGDTTIIARHILNGHSGAGIEIVQQGSPLPNAPLYVKYKKKKEEYRVHVFRGQVIDVQQKKREIGVERDEKAQMVRNRANGWVFARENIIEPDSLRSVAISAVQALGLDFGAVDIIYNQKENQCYALEVNTAPGLEGTTIEKYGEAIENYIRSL